MKQLALVIVMLWVLGCALAAAVDQHLRIMDNIERVYGPRQTAEEASANAVAMVCFQLTAGMDSASRRHEFDECIDREGK